MKKNGKKGCIVSCPVDIGLQNIENDQMQRSKHYQIRILTFSFLVSQYNMGQMKTTSRHGKHHLFFEC